MRAAESGCGVSVLAYVCWQQLHRNAKDIDSDAASSQTSTCRDVEYPRILWRMRLIPAALLLLVVHLAPACGGLDEPIADASSAAGGSGGALGDAVAGSGGIAGNAGLDAAMGGNAGLDATMGGNAGQGGSGTGGVAASGNFDCPLFDGAGAVGSSSAEAASDGSSADAGSSPDAGATLRLRVVAANISSGNFQAYELPGIRILQGLAPDVVLIQEFKYQSGTLRDLVDTAFGSPSS